MAYDNSSLTGDEICDYHYDIENNFMNPPSPTGYFIYKVIGGAFDRLNDLVTQFRNDYSILDCNVGNVEIVKSFPEEPDTNHTYYVHQPNTSTGACFTKYSYVDGGWVGETVTGDVLNSLDVFWGRSYNLPRPSLPYLYTLILEDVGTVQSHNDIWLLSNATLTRDDSYSTLLETTATGYAMSNQYNKIPPNSVVEFDICQTDGSLNYAPIYIRNDGGGVSLSNITYNNLGASIGDWVHIKIVFNNTNTITVYSDKLSEPFTKTLSATSTNYRVMLYCGGDMTTIKFKNFKIYGIVYPILFSDGGTTNNKNTNYTTGSALTISTTTYGTSVSSTSSNSTTGRYKGNTAITGDFELIADVKGNQAYSSTVGLFFGVYSNDYTIFRIKSTDWVKVKITRENSVFSVQTSTDNGTTWTDATFEQNNSTSSSVYPVLYVYHNSGSSKGLSYKNLVINSESPVYSTRLLSDEEYRVYLYLKNHQLLTMKDLLVAFTNAFGSAETSTTLLNSIHTVDHKRYDTPPFTNVTLAGYDEDDTDIITDNLVDKSGVNVVNDRLAQGTTTILIPDDGWDEEYLRFLESFISVKGNILISVGG